jgi:hypothetical protein
MRTRLLALVCCVVFLPITFALPIEAQQGTTADSNNSQSVEGTVVSATRDTLVVRGDDGEFHLFRYENQATRPAALAQGARVRVAAGAPDENGTRAATNVTVLNASAGGEGGGATGRSTGARDRGAQAAPVPEKVGQVESEIRREARRWRLGVRGGAGFNPELFMFGIHSQIGPIFHPRFQFRPSAEFDFGEVTDLIALNLEGVYRFATPYKGGRWIPYVGLGPALIFIHQNFQQGREIDFGNFDYETGFNVLLGVQSRRGTFVELKTSLYSGPAPKLRLIVGYTF